MASTAAAKYWEAARLAAPLPPPKIGCCQPSSIITLSVTWMIPFKHAMLVAITLPGSTSSLVSYAFPGLDQDFGRALRLLDECLVGGSKHSERAHALQRCA